jgi:hypothetical protein
LSSIAAGALIWLILERLTIGMVGRQSVSSEEQRIEALMMDGGVFVSISSIDTEYGVLRIETGFEQE